ncbi:interferon-induced protein 44-like [Ruditapes philippinarum]|uniref:interferon-induced protein 44-like n=1 Tax=Ruditapes philippinarum TaxID=129788 RepID=UPI00295BD366|nr:interferon-induced protein 44-like [Ruditapes philippinarum]
MGGKLTDKDMDQLEQWIGTGPKTFTLLYAITRDGCNATTFHQKCDNQGPTVTVLYNQQGSVYGGYAPVSWQSSGSYSNDQNAFLYQLHYSKTPTYTKFPRNGQGNDTYGHPSYGPTFGGGHDLYTFSGTVNNSGGYFALNGYMTSFGTSYSNQGKDITQINNGNMIVTELEVYKVTDGQRKKIKAEPWRKTKSWNEKFLDELTEDVVSFKPFPDLDISEARILMIGPVGAGKSSFYNTINSIFRGRITQRAGSGSAEQSLTTAVWFLFSSSYHGGIFIKLSKLQFNPATPISTDHDGYISKPTLEDKVHCVVFVLDSTTLEVLPAKILQKMKSFQTLMNQKGIPQALLLTKVDKLCKDVEKNVSQVFKSETVEEHVEKASQLLGLPRGNVLPVKNYENEMQLEDNISILALISLRQILHFAEDYMENIADKMAATQRKMEKMKVKK